MSIGISKILDDNTPRRRGLDISVPEIDTEDISIFDKKDEAVGLFSSTSVDQGTLDRLLQKAVEAILGPDFFENNAAPPPPPPSANNQSSSIYPQQAPQLPYTQQGYPPRTDYPELTLPPSFTDNTTGQTPGVSGITSPYTPQINSTDVMGGTNRVNTLDPLDPSVLELGRKFDTIVQGRSETLTGRVVMNELNSISITDNMTETEKDMIRKLQEQARTGAINTTGEIIAALCSMEMTGNGGQPLPVIDPALAMAVIIWETGLDINEKRNGVAELNNHGGVKQNGEFKRYPTHLQGLIDVVRVLREVYILNGKTTPADIGKDYCPVWEHPVNSQWVRGVTVLRENIRKATTG